MAKNMLSGVTSHLADTRAAVMPCAMNQILDEISIREIPVEYVNQLVVHRRNGKSATIAGDLLYEPFDEDMNYRWNAIEQLLNNAIDVKISINVPVLEKDIETMIMHLFDGIC